MTAISSPNYRWRVGEVEITRVLEFEAALFEPAVIHPEVSPEIIARHRTWLKPPLMDPASGLLVFALAELVVCFACFWAPRDESRPVRITQPQIQAHA